MPQTIFFNVNLPRYDPAFFICPTHSENKPAIRSYLKKLLQKKNLTFSKLRSGIFPAPERDGVRHNHGKRFYKLLICKKNYSQN